MFVVTLTYLRPIEEIEARTGEHRTWLDKHIASGQLIAAGPMVPRTGGVFLARGGGAKADLEALLRDDPFQVYGLVRCDIVEFAPGKYHPALAEFI